MKREYDEREGESVVHVRPARWVRTAQKAVGSTVAAAVLFVMAQPAGCSSEVDESVGGVRSEISIDPEAAQRAFHAELPRLKAIQERFEEKLFAHEGVSSIGIGLAEDGTTPVFRVIVTKQVVADALPRSIEGVALEISIGGAVKLMDGGPDCNGGMGPPCHRDQQPLPVEMGNSGAWFLGTACSLGFKACDLGTQSSVLLTNSHCAQYKNGCALAAVGDPVEHVGPMDQMPLGSGVTIGNISGHAAPSCGAASNYTDATKVTSAFFQSSRNHRDIGAPKHEISGPLPGWRVQYSGRTTGHNTGVIEAVNVTVNVPVVGGFCCGALTMKDQISFRPKYPIMGGDSGSGVLMNMRGFPKLDNRIAGLLFGADPTAGVGYFNNIDRVLSALNLTLDFTRCGFPPED